MGGIHNKFRKHIERLICGHGTGDIILIIAIATLLISMLACPAFLIGVALFLLFVWALLC